MASKHACQQLQESALTPPWGPHHQGQSSLQHHLSWVQPAIPPKKQASSRTNSGWLYQALCYATGITATWHALHNTSKDKHSLCLLALIQQLLSDTLSAPLHLWVSRLHRWSLHHTRHVIEHMQSEAYLDRMAGCATLHKPLQLSSTDSETQLASEAWASKH